MRDLKLTAILQTILLAAIVVLVWSYYPYLPQRVASHFGGSGVANGWMSKSGFAAFSIVFPIALATLLFGIQASMSLLGRMPGSMVNVPNKWYWLAPERKEETIAFLADQTSRFMLATGVATTGLMGAVTFLVMRANLEPEPRLTGFWPVLVAYLIIVVGGSIRLAVRMQRKFGRVPPDAVRPNDAAGGPVGMNPPKRYWFYAKTYGFGWGLPATWEGWVFFLLWLPTTIGGTYWLAGAYGPNTSAFLGLLLGFLGMMIAILLAVCIIKGEPLGWRWGRKDL